MLEMILALWSSLSLVDVIPVVNSVNDIVHMVHPDLIPPSAAGAVAKLASTVVFCHEISPYLKRVTDWTETPKDDAAYEIFAKLLGLATGILLALGKIDRKELQAAVKAKPVNLDAPALTPAKKKKPAAKK